MSVFSFRMSRAEKSTYFLSSQTSTFNNSRPRLRMTFYFDRQILPKFVSLYLPSFLIVCTTFVSFWVDNQAVPGRVALVITSILTLVQLLIANRKDLPPVNQVTALDFWLLACLTFACLALVEFACAYTIKWTSIKLKNKELVSSSRTELT